MKFAFIADPLHTFKIYKDTTYAMMREAAARGHQLFVMEQQDMVLRNNQVAGFAAQLDFINGGDPWYRLGKAESTPL